jgi:hypothetical protein
MCSALTKFSESMDTNRDVKLERKIVEIHASSPEKLLDELIALEQLYAEAQIPQTKAKKRWWVFRSGLRGKARDICDGELHRLKVDAEFLDKAKNEDYLMLLDYTSNKRKVDLALEAMNSVRMSEGGTVEEIERFCTEYRKAYLKQARARIIDEKHEVSVLRLVYELKNKLSTTVSEWLEQQPKQPETIEECFDILQRYADSKRKRPRGVKKEYSWSAAEKKKATKEELTKMLGPEMMNVIQKGHFGAAYQQALGKGDRAGKGKGGGNASATTETVPTQCGRCKGWHKHRLPEGKHCPNQISLDTGKLKEHLEKFKSTGETCQYWVTKGGGKKCGGQGHAYEEHLAAMKKYHADSGAAQ